MLCSQFDTLSLRYASFDLIEKMSLFWSTPIISIITIQEATFSVKRRVLANHFTAGICYLSLFLKYTKGVTASSRSCYLYIILLSKWHFIQKLQKDLIPPFGWLNLNLVHSFDLEEQNKDQLPPKIETIVDFVVVIIVRAPLARRMLLLLYLKRISNKKEELLYRKLNNPAY